MRVLIVSTYELGHQPLHAASPAAALRDAGYEVRCVDTSVQHLEPDAVAWAEAVCCSVPMHTAMRLALRVAERVKRARPDLPVCFFGLYAPVSRDHTVGRLADRVIAGRYVPALVAWVDALAAGRPTGGPEVVVGRGAARPPLPARDLLPPLERYAHLAVDGEERLVGYVEATEGCRHVCRHCPVPVVYGGRFRGVERDAVLADIDQLVAMGARHVTFGDPDFLNGPGHALALVRAVHARWPQLTFDCTTKVDHIVAHPEVWPTFADAGCLFVVSAFETTNDRILARLDKGHTAAQAVEAIRLLRAHGIEPRPSWMPFTPWTTLDDVRDLLTFVAAHDLVGNVDPVQYTIRLLLPEGSLLLDHPDLRPYLEGYDAERLTYRWAAAEPRVDALQAELAELVAARTAAGASALETFLDVDAAVAAATGDARCPQLATGSVEGRPRLTEPWFC
ncbi:MAG TPA: CUAEP/CCAEP-tail radical SAM protein [Nitriliruptorales bacterium]|nr:CUAEP/CCAEP-tail radical SAM protein [Nitriliruptorales bacterium]